MNDPNGLVFHKGLYHLYFQHNPHGRHHANMSWGHATSPDLVHWTEHEVAILHDDAGAIFSGSVVVDEANTSGLGRPGEPAMVAIYTLVTPGRQAQALAFSLDDGYTWTKYEGNPVLDRGSADFRDPKVFRFIGDNESYWVMVAVEARERQVLFYRSDDLLRWSYLSSYGPAGAVGGVWECPDLFPLPLDGDVGDRRWVLLISLSPGAVAGGSGTQYVVGHFDGTVFSPDEPRPALAWHSEGGYPVQSREELEEFCWLDHGRDCYAGVTFSGLPETERVLVAWMSNWDYAREIPTAPWRGAMTLARRLELVTQGGRRVLRQIPVTGSDLRPVDVPTRLPLGLAIAAAGVLDLQARLEPGARLAIRLGDGLTEGAEIILDGVTGTVLCTRHAAPEADMPAGFHGTQYMGDVPRGRSWSLRICFDAGSVEVFAADGTRVLTDLVWFRDGARSLTMEAPAGGVVVEELRLSEVDERV
jgi:sucrose-6-phosphate hydrolase SacC (GH32 family)